MKSTTISIIMLAFAMLFFAPKSGLISQESEMDKTIYQFDVETIGGEKISLEEYKGKVVLIVNVASKCGFTPQYEGLQELYQKYQDQGFVVLGFPCNQFRNQEPGSNEEIMEFCSTNYGVTFPMFSKIDVNGENAHPLYKFLKSEQSGLITDEIKWNFTKFLVDRNGKPVDRFATTTKPESIEKDIEKLLN
jgi:glutathione peroxidase